MIVLDANILIRAVMGRRVSQLLEEYSALRLRFCAPTVAFADAEKYLPDLLKKFNKSDRDVALSIQYLQHLVEPIDQDFYGIFEDEARDRLRGRDEEN